MLRRIASFARRFVLPNWRLMLLMIVTGLCAAAASGLGVPLLLRYVFPVVFPSADGEMPLLLQQVPMLQSCDRATLLLLACGSIPAVFVLRGFFLWLNAVTVTRTGLHILEMLRMEAFRHVQRLPLGFLEKHRKGDLLSRLVTDTQSVQTVLTNVANDLVKQPITTLCALAAFVVLLVQTGHAFLFLINLVFISLAVVPVMVFGKRIMIKAKRAQANMGELNALLQQNLETQREVRAYGLEQQQTDDFSRASEAYCRNVLKLVKYQKALVPVMETVTSLALAVLLVQGRRCGMDLTMFMAMAAALFFLFDSLKRAGQAFNNLNEAQGAMMRISEILDEPLTMLDPQEPKHFKQPLRGEIRFRGVSFAYDEASEPALRDVDLVIPAGQVVGLVGPSGAGKTTFASLIPRFYEVTEGAIELDGIDLREVSKHELREQIAFVGQQALLFAGTIRENIQLGSPSADERALMQAADAAAVTPFLAAQPQGMDTVLSDGGSGLSGGQRQRVAIARAFIKEAPVLILDEATASLDAESESEVQRALEELSQGRTTLIVAHRFSTIRHAQRILVFDAGRIIADGSHDELYAGCPLYRELYDRQGM